VKNIKLALLNGLPEIFHSIQGEGKSIGRPSIFVRTSLCNLHCVWCDTDYTWNWLGTPFPHQNDADAKYQKFDQKDWIATLPIEEMVQIITAMPCKTVIWTGGEPMMQQKQIAQAMAMLKSIDPSYQFEIETNGTYTPKPEFEELINQYNVSPKLANSGNESRIRDKALPMRYFAESPKANFKFVIGSHSDITEVLALKKKYQIANNKIYLMPQADHRKQMEQMRQEVVNLCLEHQFHYSDRLHIQIWDKKKGV
jgi:7-carboxy-7-deazaguanine synthase